MSDLRFRVKMDDGLLLSAVNKKLKMELLAPAGGPEAGYAALHYGADAIYLGLPKFSARADAENFSLDHLDNITGYAHSRSPRRKVYVTVNTLVLQEEMGELIETLAALADIGVDALIVQDLGVLRVVRRHFPEFRLHASTQMAIHNRAGVATARQLGFNRVTLARELTLAEIADSAAVAGIETECFIHGALCYSYSGLCLFSSQAIGRSGNRGRCAYFCRNRFTIAGVRGACAPAAKPPAGPAGAFLFSMKDLALPDYLGRLASAGVTAVKIEGRKKSPLYVAAAVNYYRQLLDGKLTAAAGRDGARDIQTIFSRPWTSLFIASRRNQNVVDRVTLGHRGTPIGKVESVRTLRPGVTRLRFHSDRPLEVHDGLQIDIPGWDRPFGFAVEHLKILAPASAMRPGFLFQAPADCLLEVDVPADHPQLPVGAPIYCASSQELKRRYRYDRPKPGQYRVRRSVDVEVAIDADGVRVTAAASLNGAPGAVPTIVVRQPGVFKPARNPQQVESAVRQAFGKLGATRMILGRLMVKNPDQRFVPVSHLNELRRNAMDAMQKRLDAVRQERLKQIVRAEIADESTHRQPAATRPAPTWQWSLKIDRLGFLAEFQAEDWRNVEEIIIEIDRDPLAALTAGLNELKSRLEPDRIRLALPIITRGWESAGLQDKIAHLRAAGWRKWEAANLSAWNWLTAAGNAELDLTADWPLYATNCPSGRQLLAMGCRTVTLSPEDGRQNLGRMLAGLGSAARVIVYQDTPLFISEACVVENWQDHCADKQTCGPVLELISAFGDRVVATTRQGRTVVVNQKPYCLAAYLPALAAAGTRRLRADFMYRDYTPTQVRERWRQLRAGRPLPGTQPGNFERGLE